MIGPELTMLRTQHGESQAELADAIGVYRPRISEWERGLYKMNKVYARLIREHYVRKMQQA
jgi:transcriptional regulator with XRE-family HTH domain